MSFFKKLKDLPDFQEEPQETEINNPEQDDFALQKLTASINKDREEPTKTEKVKKKVKKIKKFIVEEKNTQLSIQTPKPTIAPITIAEPVQKTQKIETQKKPEKTPQEEKKWPEPEGQLATDVYETENELIIQTAVAGVKPGNLDITAQGDIVVIKGRRDNPNTKEEKKYFYQECYWGAFSREIILPAEADTSRTEATMVDGILTIKIPKIAKEKGKKIVI